MGGQYWVTVEVNQLNLDQMRNSCPHLLFRDFEYRGMAVVMESLEDRDVKDFCVDCGMMETGRWRWE